MKVSIDILGIIYIIAALQGFLLTILLFTKYRKSGANRYLAWLILLYSLYVIRVFLFSIPEIASRHAHLLMIFDGLPFLFGPLHLIYVGVLTDTRLAFAKPHWLHFAPFVIYRIYYLRIFFLSKEELNSIIAQVSQGIIPLHIAISSTILAVQGLVYVTVALIVFQEYSKKIKLTFSSLARINLSWLRYFTLLALIVWIIVFVDNLTTILGFEVRPLFVLVPFLTSVFVYATGYIGMFKTEIFLQSDIYENIHSAKNLALELGRSESGEKGSDKYKKSGLSDNDAEQYLEKLRLLMESEEVYTDPDITLRDISDRSGISTHNISEVINTRLGQNFFDYINEYRIEKVKKDLVDRTRVHLTIFGIALDAGFNSKSGFNAIFKRFTGLTPSEYRRKVS